MQKYCGSDRGLLKKISREAIEPVVDIINDIKSKLDSPELSQEDIILHFDKLGFGSVLSTGSKFVKADDYETIC